MTTKTQTLVLKLSLLAACVSWLAIAPGCASSDMVSRAEFDASQAAQRQLQQDVDALQAQNAQLAKLNAQRQALYDDLRQRLGGLIDAGKLTLRFRRGMMVLEMPNQVLFDSGATKLKPEGVTTLKQVATALRGLKTDRRLLVAGHTDNVPVSTKSEQWKSNWSLSNERSLTVLKVLVSEGVSPKVLASAGFGEHDPIGDNGTDTGRAQNRRIELVILPNLDGVIQTTPNKRAELDR